MSRIRIRECLESVTRRVPFLSCRGRLSLTIVIFVSKCSARVQRILEEENNVSLRGGGGLGGIGQQRRNLEVVCYLDIIFS